ncbi:UNVERIFIED_ORG: ribulose 1,5-bisphosphate synthetase/thiazole synthase [Bacillus sp. B2I3]|nr:ribulose 1,5-bisphosphate synthetase/thiazole synthase [Bacillus sp. B2I3]
MHYDVIVIGAGSMGMSSGYYLSKKDKKYYYWIPLLLLIIRGAITGKQELLGMLMVKAGSMFLWHLNHKSFGVNWKEYRVNNYFFQRGY